MRLIKRRFSALMLSLAAAFSVCTVSALAAETTEEPVSAASSGLSTWIWIGVIAAVVIAVAVIAFFALRSKKVNAADGDAKNQKRSVGEKLKKFWRDYKSELKKITWSPWKSVKKNTVIVLVLLVLLSAVIGLIDYLSSNGITLLGRLAG